ncbi:MAG: glutamyl-tRNA synthetase [Paracoccaceae bacterium]|jgi:glutamyl-tRNA synthetase
MNNFNTEIVTRFAPSPTGDLHIGGARTALFNWLYARAKGGKFLLRIEDTDTERSTKESLKTILDGLCWLELDWDGEPVSQKESRGRHQEIAYRLLETGKAYKCFSTQDEIENFRQNAKSNRESTLFKSPWRNRDELDFPNKPFSIRLSVPENENISVKDLVQGEVTWQSDQIDDLIILRSDGSPTYNLAVVVDDHDMNISHVIRGDDHLSNSARQKLIYTAMQWRLPSFAHIPLIHGEDGKKLSKRHGARNLTDYAKLGYTPAGIRNYLCRLGWSHGDDEIFTTVQAQTWFDLGAIGKAPARLNSKKMDYINKQQILMADDDDLLQNLNNYISINNIDGITDSQIALIIKAIPLLKSKAKTIANLLEQANFSIISRPFIFDDEEVRKLFISNKGILLELIFELESVSWSHEILELTIKKVVDRHGIKFGDLAKPIRIALSSKPISPSIVDMMLVLEREETVARLRDVVILAAPT